MSTQTCLNKMYVRLRYIPPRHPEQPADCKQVKITKSPKIEIAIGEQSKLKGLAPSGQIIRGIDLHCVVPTTSGAGAVILLLQVSSYIEWEIEFLNKQGRSVREIHRVFVSLPMMYKIAGPRVMLMALTPWYLKMPVYAAQIWNAFQKLEELEKPMAEILALRKGFCPGDINALEEGLKKIETELNYLIIRVQQGDIARRMENKIDGTGRFTGTRLA
jgi:hypothetical protein